MNRTEYRIGTMLIVNDLHCLEIANKENHNFCGYNKLRYTVPKVITLQCKFK